MTVSLQGSLMVDIAGKWLTAEDRHLLRQPKWPADHLCPQHRQPTSGA